MRGRRFHSSGYTLLEMLMTVILLTMLLLFGLPSMLVFVDTMRLDTANRAMISSLQLARSSAAAGGRRVVLCKSADGVSCGQAQGWEQGWIVFQDSNNNAHLDEGERVLHREPALGARLRMRGNRPVEGYIAYTPLGQTQLTNGAFQAGTLTACMLSLEQSSARQIVISASGRARTQAVRLEFCA